MINLSASIREMEKMPKKELRKTLREIGKQANLKLREWYEGGEWNELSINRRKQIEGYLVNRGKFYIAPRSATKRELATYISHARTFINLKPENNEALPDWIVDMSESFQQYYDPSEFWNLFYSEFIDYNKAYAHRIQEEQYLDLANKLAERVASSEEFMSRLINDGWQALDVLEAEKKQEQEEQEEQEDLFDF